MDKEMSYEDVATIFTQLSEIPPQEWHTDPTLDEQSRKVASLLPTNQLDGSEPGFLFIAGEIRLYDYCYACDPPRPVPSIRVSEQLEAVGVDVQLLRIDNSEAV